MQSSTQYTRLSQSSSSSVSDQNTQDIMRENLKLHQQIAQREQERYEYHAKLFELQCQLDKFISSPLVPAPKQVQENENEDVGYIVAENIVLKNELASKKQITEVDDKYTEAVQIVHNDEITALKKKHDDYYARSQAHIIELLETMEQMKAHITVFASLRDEARAECAEKDDIIEGLKARIVIYEDEKVINAAKIMELENNVDPTPTPTPTPSPHVPKSSFGSDQLTQLLDNVDSLTTKYNDEISILKKKVATLEDEKRFMIKTSIASNDNLIEASQEISNLKSEIAHLKSELANITNLKAINANLQEELSKREVTLAKLTESFSHFLLKIDPSKRESSF